MIWFVRVGSRPQKTICLRPSPPTAYVGPLTISNHAFLITAFIQAHIVAVTVVDILGFVYEYVVYSGPDLVGAPKLGGGRGGGRM